MANKKISELASATTPLAGTELVEVVQGGVNKKVAVSNFGGGSGGVQSVTGDTVDNTDPDNPAVGVPTFQQVTDEGATTTNPIETGNIKATDVNGGEFPYGSDHNFSEAGIMQFTDLETSFGIVVDAEEPIASVSWRYPAKTAGTYKFASEEYVTAELLTTTREIIKDVVPSTGVNSTVVETVLKSYLIPANKMLAEDIANIVSMRFKSGGLGGTITYRYYINTVNSLSGAVLIGGVLQSTGANVTTKMSNKTYTVYGGNIEGVFTVGSASFVDSGSSSTALGTTAFDHTIDNYFIITAQLGTSNTNNARLVECLVTH